VTLPLLILDLDETLIFGTETPLSRPPDFMVGPFGIHLRPHLERFMARVAAHYRLAVWTVATVSYAAPIVTRIFPATRPPAFLWCRDRCTRRQDPETREEYWLKNLRKVKRLGYDLDRVLMIDDTPRNLERHYGNCLTIAPYTGAPDDDELAWLAEYLVRIADCPNFRAREKRGWRDETARSAAAGA
jgi:RNA polymerase II subunit A small phosphatase-like protein